MNKVLIVTGGSRGIGAATAELAGQRGYAVCVNYLHNRAAADVVVEATERAGGKAIAVTADVAVEDDVMRLFETVDRELGTVTALVNNAGILERQARLEEIGRGALAADLCDQRRGQFLVRTRSGAPHVHAARRARWRDCQCVIRRCSLGRSG
jgi:NAD(P)-dependent dehydrogenase (short-subunit alcohol dehydrogenase family)